MLYVFGRVSDMICAFGLMSHHTKQATLMRPAMSDKLCPVLMSVIYGRCWRGGGGAAAHWHDTLFMRPDDSRDRSSVVWTQQRGAWWRNVMTTTRKSLFSISCGFCNWWLILFRTTLHTARSAWLELWHSVFTAGAAVLGLSMQHLYLPTLDMLLCGMASQEPQCSLLPGMFVGRAGGGESRCLWWPLEDGVRLARWLAPSTPGAAGREMVTWQHEEEGSRLSAAPDRLLVVAAASLCRSSPVLAQGDPSQLHPSTPATVTWPDRRPVAGGTWLVNEDRRPARRVTVARPGGTRVVMTTYNRQLPVVSQRIPNGDRCGDMELMADYCVWRCQQPDNGERLSPRHDTR